MDIETFVKESLNQISKAILESGIEYEYQHKNETKIAKTGFEISADSAVEFEILVATTEEVSGGGGVKLQIFSAGVNASNIDSSVSKIKFKVKVGVYGISSK